jgi:integrase
MQTPTSVGAIGGWGDTRSGPQLSAWRAAVLVSVTTGIRRGELLGLRWSDIDLKAARLTVNQSLERLGGKTNFQATKDHWRQAHHYPPGADC